jgi:hypothetical protein
MKKLKFSIIGIFCIGLFLFSSYANAYSTTTTNTSLQYKYKNGDVLTYACSLSQIISNVEGTFSAEANFPSPKSYNTYLSAQFVNFDYSKANETTINLTAYDGGEDLPLDLNPLTNDFFEWSKLDDYSFNINQSVNNILFNLPLCIFPANLSLENVITENLINELKIMNIQPVDEYFNYFFENVTILNYDTMTGSGNVSRDSVNYTIIESASARILSDLFTFSGDTPALKLYNANFELKITIQGDLSLGKSWKNLLITAELSMQVFNISGVLILGYDANGTFRLNLVYDSTGMGYSFAPILIPQPPNNNGTTIEEIVPSWVWYVITIGGVVILGLMVVVVKPKFMKKTWFIAEF